MSKYKSIKFCNLHRYGIFLPKSIVVDIKNNQYREGIVIINPEKLKEKLKNSQNE